MRRSFAIAGALAIMTGLFVGPMAGPARASWAACAKPGFAGSSSLVTAG